ncbi:hypothetical protein CRM22_004979 [Opisthorchis felineus]|nr:hypothetical protein CRM22_004979 [Opisthorchis felineus]
MGVATAWFPTRRALIFGLVVGGFGLGALIFTPIQTSFINPDNLSTVGGVFVNTNLLDRVPKCFLLCGGILLGIQIIGFCLMQQRPSVKPGEEEEVEEEDVKREKEFEEEEPIEKEINLKPKDLIRRLDFYLLWFILLFAAIPITIIASAYKLFGQAYITDDRFLSAVATVSSVFNCGGRIVWGLIVDKVSFKLPLCILLSIWAAVLVTFPHLYLAGETALRVLYVIWVCLLWFTLSGMLTIMPSATATLFGQKNVATNYGVVYSAFSVGSLLCGIFQTFLPEQTYVVQFSACFALVAAGLIVTLWVTDSKMSPRMNICKKLTEQCGRLRGRDQQSDDFILRTVD